MSPKYKIVSQLTVKYFSACFYVEKNTAKFSLNMYF